MGRMDRRYLSTLPEFTAGGKRATGDTSTNLTLDSFLESQMTTSHNVALHSLACPLLLRLPFPVVDSPSLLEAPIVRSFSLSITHPGVFNSVLSTQPLSLFYHAGHPGHLVIWLPGQPSQTPVGLPVQWDLTAR